MAGNCQPKSIKGNNHANNRIHDFPRHVSTTHQITTSDDAQSIEARSDNRPYGIHRRANDSLRDVQWGNGSDSSGSADELSNERHEASLRIYRRELLSRRSHQAERLKPLLDVALFSAAGEIARLVIRAGWKTLLTTMRFLK